MKIGMAVKIFNDIYNPGFTMSAKANAIWTVMGMTTHNGITKDKMLDVMRWMFNELFEFVEDNRK